jgi:acyl carrier protein
MSTSKFAKLLAEVFEVRVSDITPDLRKADVGSWDSLKQMDLVLCLEREYEITLDIPDILRMTSVAQIKAVLLEKGIQVED